LYFVVETLYKSRFIFLISFTPYKLKKLSARYNFFKSYKKYLHFAEESVTFGMDGPQDLSYNQPVQVRFKLQRVADLVRDIYFLFDLPDIYCKALELPVSTQSGTRTSQYNFAWVTHIGCHIIQEIGFYIAGQKIQGFDGSYMITKAQCDLDTRAFQKWSRLVGNIPDLYSKDEKDTIINQLTNKAKGAGYSADPDAVWSFFISKIRIF
jgi:hypothetical protein